MTQTPQPPPSDTALSWRFFQRVTEVAGALRWVVFIPLNAVPPSQTYGGGALLRVMSPFLLPAGSKGAGESVAPSGRTQSSR